MLTPKKLISIFAGLVFLGGLAIIVMAATTAEQMVQVSVQEINNVEVSGSVSFTISQINAAAIDSSTTITYATNSTIPKKITAAPGITLPAGITLKVEVEDGAGQKTLSTPANAVDVVTGLTQVKDTKIITYVVNVGPQVEEQTLNCPVTFTITD